MSDHRTWRDMNGERWFSATISLAPLELPAFSVTWWRVDCDRVKRTGAFRLRADLLEETALPDWLLLLGAMGLHVYRERDQLVVQDRAGLGDYHDAYRVLLVERFVHWQAETQRAWRGPLAESCSEFAQLVRHHLAEGFWDLPAGAPLPGDAPTGERLRARADVHDAALADVHFPKTMAYRRYARGGPRPTTLGSDFQPPPRTLARRAPRTPSPSTTETSAFTTKDPRPSSALGYALHAYMNLGASFNPKPGTDPVVGLLFLLLYVLGLPFLVLYWVVRLPVALLYVLVVPKVTPTSDASERIRVPGYALDHPVDDRDPFVQLHDALTVEGLLRLDRQGDLVAVEQWLVHMEEVFADYRALTAPSQAPRS
jgi:hypothetical protein